MLSSAVILVLGFASGCATDSPSGPVPAADQASLAEVASGTPTMAIRSRLDASKCLTVQNGNIADGTRTELQPCDGRSSQQFTVVPSDGTIRIGSNFCLDASDDRAVNGDPIIVWTCHGGRNQKWRTTDASEIRGLGNMCVDVSDALAKDGQPIILWKCHGESNQKWDVVTTTSPDPTPTPAPVSSVGVTLGKTSLAVGDTTRATATLKDSSGTVLTGQTVSWSSSAPTVASVTAAGLVTALAAGTANIVATADGKNGSTTVTVTAPTTPPPTTEPPASCSMVTDWNARPTTAMAKPGYLAPVTEPDFGTRLVRITGDPGTPITLAGGGTAGTWGNLAGDAYAKEPVWNADQSLMVLRVMDSPGGPLFLDGNTYQPLFRRGSVPGTFGPKWHPTNPDLMVYINANGSVGLWNVRTQATSLVYSTSAYNNASPGAGEGNVSANGYMVVQANRNADGHKVAYAVDVTSGARGGDIDLTNAGVSAVDWVSVSQLGGYVVVDGTIDGAGQRVKAWNRATGAQTAYWPTNPMGHFDLGVNAAGREVAFGAASGGAYPTRFVTLDLGNGTVAPMSPATSWDWHASTRNTRRQGWGYASTNNLTSFVLSGEIYALKLDGSQSVERYGHFRSNQTDYEAAPFPSPSPDGKRIVFRSNWGASSGRPVQTYVFDTRSCP